MSLKQFSAWPCWNTNNEGLYYRVPRRHGLERHELPGNYYDPFGSPPDYACGAGWRPLGSGIKRGSGWWGDRTGDGRGNGRDIL